jgi:HEAT repeat protein
VRVPRPRHGRARADPSGRLRAVLALPDGPEAIPALLAAADDPSPDVARAALARISRHGGAAEAGRLRGGLLRADPAVVRDRAAALRELGDGEAVPVAVGGLAAPLPGVRMAAAIALGELGDAGAGTALAGALADPIAAVRRCALDSLAMLGPDRRSAGACAPLLADPDAGVRAAAVDAVCALAGAADPRLAPLAGDPGTRVRRTLARHAGSLGAATAQALLRDRDADVRLAAVRSLAGVPRRDLLEAVVAALADEAWQVRHAACAAAAAAGGRGAVGALVPLLADPHATVRGAARRTLCELRGAGLAGTVGCALAGAGPALRRRLVHVLEICPPADAVAVLAGCADDPDADVRIAAAVVLGGTGREQARSVLRPLLADGDWRVRRAAEGALQRLGQAGAARRTALTPPGASTSMMHK